MAKFLDMALAIPRCSFTQDLFWLLSYINMEGELLLQYKQISPTFLFINLSANFMI